MNMTLDDFRKQTGRPSDLWASLRRLAATREVFDFAAACEAAKGHASGAVSGALSTLVHRGEFCKKGLWQATALWSAKPFAALAWNEMRKNQRRAHTLVKCQALGTGFTIAEVAQVLGVSGEMALLLIAKDLKALVASADLDVLTTYPKLRFEVHGYVPPPAPAIDWADASAPLTDRYAALRAGMDIQVADIAASQRFTERNSIEA